MTRDFLRNAPGVTPHARWVERHRTVDAGKFDSRG